MSLKFPKIIHISDRGILSLTNRFYDYSNELILGRFYIRKILLGLNTNKACGSDGIPPIVLKKCAPELTSVLCKLFNYSYKLGIFPSNWKIARVQPVPKKGKKTLPSNYRTIALLSIILKIMKKAINIELMKYLEHSGIINDRQYGLRHQRSTGDLLSHIWQQSIEKYGETLAVALDITKTFDRVWHHGLLAKLPSYGLPPQLYPGTSTAADSEIEIKDLPKCKKCQHLVRPYIVWFGENLDADVMRRSKDLIESCDLCLIIGTSSVVYPAAMFAPRVAERGKPVAEFNMNEEPADGEFAFHFPGQCGTTLPKALGIASE
ncbi:unnamed protein product [Phaedon cochleariae]|uniref:Deacetylase sirtuin-type domain-containing protein n=1 Tax=Phaedon cochleariae TaxID=80249 RepID=A0A9N9SID7_PHACE|nr:unnamed protein product [Phaedon cochleariae]